VASAAESTLPGRRASGCTGRYWGHWRWGVGGLDVFNTIGGYLFPELNHEIEGLKLLDEWVARGHLGAKSGAEFYE
jgi:hypothetical protein